MKPTVVFADSLKTELLKYADKVIEGAEQTPFHAPYGNDAKDFFLGMPCGEMYESGCIVDVRLSPDWQRRLFD